MVQVPATMAKLAAAMTALAEQVEAQVARSAAIGPSAYDAFEAALMDRVAAIESAAHEPALSALDSTRRRSRSTASASVACCARRATIIRARVASP
ncbi:MAG: hypothetical protein KF850_23010 [Labilithrix sp.]|nr:hypothetical protein [Labilithrix sp.]